MQQQLSLADAIVSIINTYGVDILKDGNRFCAILGDIAPTLDKERKIIRRAKDEDVLPLIWEAYSVDATKRASILSKIEYRLKSEAGFSEEWYQTLKVAFSEAFSWGVPSVTQVPAVSTRKVPASKKKYLAKNTAKTNMLSHFPDEIHIPEDFTAIGWSAFEGWHSRVENIIIPDTITEIQDFAFCDIKVSGFVSIPNSVTSMGRHPFTLEKNAYIKCSRGSYAYQYCIENQLPNSVDEEYAAAVNSMVFSDTIASALIDGLRDLVILQGTTSIEEGAFRNRDDFEFVVADDDLKFIEKGAFSNCKLLQGVALGQGVQRIASEAFLHCVNLKMVYIDVESDFFVDSDARLSNDIARLTISDTAFMGCEKLKYIVSVWYCEALHKFCKANRITYVYDDVLLDKHSSNVLPEDLEHIERYLCHRHAKYHIAKL